MLSIFFLILLINNFLSNWKRVFPFFWET